MVKSAPQKYCLTALNPKPECCRSASRCPSHLPLLTPSVPSRQQGAEELHASYFVQTKSFLEMFKSRHRTPTAICHVKCSGPLIHSRGDGRWDGSQIGAIICGTAGGVCTCFCWVYFGRVEGVQCRHCQMHLQTDCSDSHCHQQGPRAPVVQSLSLHAAFCSRHVKQCCPVVRVSVAPHWLFTGHD